MFGELLEKEKEFKNKIKYHKHLGWKESNDEGDSVTAQIIVFDVGWGFNVFRMGKETPELLNFCRELDEAVEWAVDRSRQEIADHEIQQVKRD